MNIKYKNVAIMGQNKNKTCQILWFYNPQK